jgi:hypothetical protein
VSSGQSRHLKVPLSILIVMMLTASTVCGKDDITNFLKKYELNQAPVYRKFNFN